MNKTFLEANTYNTVIYEGMKFGVEESPSTTQFEPRQQVRNTIEGNTLTIERISSYLSKSLMNSSMFKFPPMIVGRSVINSFKKVRSTSVKDMYRGRETMARGDGLRHHEENVILREAESPREKRKSEQ
ncbi:hypothetical protein GEMRC1_012221 [Eukaryota sp. GEM-RC1]